MVDPFAVPLPDPTPQLRALRAALTRLAGCALPGPARVALAEAQMALSALESLHSGTVDRSVFDALMAMAGPEVAPELVAQMAADLRAVRVALAVALDGMDWAGIRSQTHVLVALAGSAGARGLEQGSQALNLAAHETDALRVRALGPGILTGLDGLIRFVEAAGSGGAAVK
ncbi:hypothetical protein [Pseudotabrizicola sp. 4114]|uniref:hypothetical protein n=1 Tax=Pseudotabrizicola sp. 4114 TaxID=2817731 RepID=UPI00285A87A1|nr:hypothetical protein [Pseudorhodobacter sp. 4114]